MIASTWYTMLKPTACMYTSCLRIAWNQDAHSSLLKASPLDYNVGMLSSQLISNRYGIGQLETLHRTLTQAWWFHTPCPIHIMVPSSHSVPLPHLTPVDELSPAFFFWIAWLKATCQIRTSSPEFTMIHQFIYLVVKVSVLIDPLCVHWLLLRKLLVIWQKIEH